MKKKKKTVSTFKSKEKCNLRLREQSSECLALLLQAIDLALHAKVNQYMSFSFE